MGKYHQEVKQPVTPRGKYHQEMQHSLTLSHEPGTNQGQHTGDDDEGPQHRSKGGGSIVTKVKVTVLGLHDLSELVLQEAPVAQTHITARIVHDVFIQVESDLILFALTASEIENGR